MHEMTARARVLAISGADACLFSDDQTISGLGDESPGVVVTMTGLCFVRTEGNPADTLVCLELYDAGLNWAVEDLQPVESALARFLRRLVENIFDDYEPAWPRSGIGEPSKGTVAICWISSSLWENTGATEGS